MLPTLSDIPPYLLTRIGASAMDALERYGWLGEKQTAHPRTMPSPDPLPETGEKRKHSKTVVEQPDPSLLTTKEAAALLGILPESMAGFARQNRLGRVVQVGQRHVYRFTREEVEGFREEAKR